MNGWLPPRGGAVPVSPRAGRTTARPAAVPAGQAWWTSTHPGHRAAPASLSSTLPPALPPRRRIHGPENFVVAGCAAAAAAILSLGVAAVLELGIGAVPGALSSARPVGAGLNLNRAPAQTVGDCLPSAPSAELRAATAVAFAAAGFGDGRAPLPASPAAVDRARELRTGSPVPAQRCPELWIDATASSFTLAVPRRTGAPQIVTLRMERPARSGPIVAAITDLLPAQPTK